MTALVLALALPVLPGCSATDRGPAETSSAAASPSKPGESAPSVSAVDVRAAEFQSKWWTWASAPEAVNPVTDTTGEHCAQGQPGDVWLVAGSFGGAVARRCVIPAGLPIAGPVVNLVSPDAAGCESFLERAGGEVSVLKGGTPKIVEVTPVRFEFTAQKGNPSGFRAGRNEGYGCGLWFTVDPLPAGRHQLVIKGHSGDFTVQATYNLTVKDASGL
ncbi:hypothetical protein [Kribbella sp. NPDC023855]|uniref:hypothetical protein n=1 Tax=Kribbella sp. NPDC023855 TaxID=3154698 RepID=UPI0033C9E9A3